VGSWGGACTDLADVCILVVHFASGLLVGDHAHEGLVVWDIHWKNQLPVKIVDWDDSANVQERVPWPEKDVEGQLSDGVLGVADHHQAVHASSVSHCARHLFCEFVS